MLCSLLYPAFRNTLHQISTHCNTLQHTVTHCDTSNARNDLDIYVVLLNEHETHCSTLQHTRTHRNILQHTIAHCNTLQHEQCSYSSQYLRCPGTCIVKHTTVHYDTLQHTAARAMLVLILTFTVSCYTDCETHCSALQHATTRCNTRNT